MARGRILSQLAVRHGPQLAERAIAGLIDAGGAVKRAAKPSLGQRIATFALLRVATRSVPGAILVGGGLVVKAVHAQRKARRAQRRPDA
ncbi:MAG: hypothetical protein KGK11_09135 [Sphingomonadales bacterium]|nr:hypothetical protein [Sphingomonadales bacterium]